MNFSRPAAYLHIKTKTMLKALAAAGITPTNVEDDGDYTECDPEITLHPRLAVQIALYDGTYILNAYKLDADGHIKTMMQLGTHSSARGLMPLVAEALARLTKVTP